VITGRTATSTPAYSEVDDSHPIVVAVKANTAESVKTNDRLDRLLKVGSDNVDATKNLGSKGAIPRYSTARA
jgi:hypothetical protein